jgi:hypothetical protein
MCLLLREREKIRTKGKKASSERKDSLLCGLLCAKFGEKSTAMHSTEKD